MNLAQISACLLTIQICGPLGQELGALNTGSGNYDEAYKTGVAEAERQLEAGAATLYVCGLRKFGENLDRETGLPCEAIAGCVVTTATRGRLDGHNGRVAMFIAERGLPSNSFKRWERDLFDLRGYFQKRSKNEKPFRLTLGGPAAKSADGKYSVRLARKKFKFTKEDGPLVERLSIVVSVAGVDRESIGAYDDESAFYALWGPKGSSFAVIHKESPRESFIMAVDLERGEMLRTERLPKKPVGPGRTAQVPAAGPGCCECIEQSDHLVKDCERLRAIKLGDARLIKIIDGLSSRRRAA